MKNPRKITTTPVPPKSGTVSVTVVEPDRLAAITALARSIESLAHALAEPTQVSIKDCNVSHAQVGINVASQ